MTDPAGEKGTYSGTISCITDLPHGKGRFDYEKPGRFYDGEWRDGHWTGQGRLSTGTGDLYEGVWKKISNMGME